MTRIFNPRSALVISFLAMVAGVPVMQVVIEARRGEWPLAAAALPRKPVAKNLRAYERTLEDASVPADWMRAQALYAQFAWLKDGGEKTLVGRDGWLFYKPGVQYLTDRPGVEKSAATGRDALAAIVAFRDQLAARGIRLIVVPVPGKESIHPEMLTSRESRTDSAISPETRELLDALKAADVDVVDLFAAFTAAKRPVAAPLYLAQDTHWSPAGMELAAHLVALRIAASTAVQPGGVIYLSKPAPVDRTGDLVRMLRVPRIERGTQVEHAACEQITGDDGRPYRDDPASPVLVIGDSFLRIYETDEPGAAGFVAHLAAELKRPLSSLVSDGGASTLVRQELSRRPALLAKTKVVVWEFVERDIRFGIEGWQQVPLPAVHVNP